MNLSSASLLPSNTIFEIPKENLKLVNLHHYFVVKTRFLWFWRFHLVDFSFSFYLRIRNLKKMKIKDFWIQQVYVANLHQRKKIETISGSEAGVISVVSKMKLFKNDNFYLLIQSSERTICGNHGPCWVEPIGWKMLYSDSVSMNAKSGRFWAQNF